MKGTIIMEFDGPQTKITVKADNVGIEDKCVAIDNLLSALEAEGMQRLAILAAVMEVSMADNKGGNKVES